MSISFQHRTTASLLAALLLGCSGSSGNPHAETAAAQAATSSAPATSATVSKPEAAPAASGTATSEPDDASTSSVSPAPPSAATTAATEPAQTTHARPNQADQAKLAAQMEAALHVPEPASVAPVASTSHAHGALTHPANVAMAVHTAPPVVLHAAPVATTPIHHLTAVTAIDSTTALRRARFASLATHFELPSLISHRDTTASPPQVMSLRMDHVGISNFDDTSRVNFALKSAESDWTNDYLDPRDSREFGCGLVGDCLFWMQTGDASPVTYTMHSNQRYAIFWDAQKGMWDLRLAAAGD